MLSCRSKVGVCRRAGDRACKSAARGCAGIVRLRIGGRHRQRSAGILSAQTVQAVCGKVGCVAETVQSAERQAAIVVAGVLDRTVDSERVVGVVVIEGVGKQVTRLVHHRIILAAKGHGAELTGWNANESLTPELAAAVAKLAAVHDERRTSFGKQVRVKSVLERENGQQAATKILGAF